MSAAVPAPIECPVTCRAKLGTHRNTQNRTGTLRHIQAHRHTGTQTRRHTGTQGHRHTQAHRHIGIQAYRHTGTHMYTYTGAHRYSEEARKTK